MDSPAYVNNQRKRSGTLKMYPFAKPQILARVGRNVDKQETVVDQQDAIIFNFLKNQFFKFLFFDQYVLDGGGSDYFSIVNKFRLYIEKFNPRTDPTLLAIYKQLFTDESYWIKTVRDYNIFNQYYSSKKHYIMLSGWSTANGGHAITVYFKKLGPNKNDIYFVNSGAGLQYHGTENENGRPIVVKFSNKSDENVQQVYEISQFLTNQGIVKRDDNLSKLGNFIVHPWTRRNFGQEGAISEGKLVELIEFMKDNQQKKPDFVINRALLQRPGFGSEWGEDPSAKPPAVLEFHLPLLFYKNVAKYYINNQKIGEDLFYNCMFGDERPVPVRYDKPQLSGSCTFYSSYHFIKNFLINNEAVFTDFISKVKQAEAEEHYTNVLKQLTTSQGFINHDIIPSVVNSSLMLLKDTGINEQVKGAIRSLIVKQLSSFDNSCLTNGKIHGIEEQYKETRDDFLIIVNSYRDFMMGDKSIELLINTFSSWSNVSHNRLHKWAWVLAIKMSIALYNTIEPSIQIPVLEHLPGKNVYYDWFQQQPIIQMLSKVYWQEIFTSSVYNGPEADRTLSYIFIQCILKHFILPDGMTEIPYAPRVELTWAGEKGIFDDTVIKSYIIEKYKTAKMSFIKGFPLERTFKLLGAYRGLLAGYKIVWDASVKGTLLYSWFPPTPMPRDNPNILDTLIKYAPIWEEDSVELQERVFFTDEFLSQSTLTMNDLQYIINSINIKNITEIPVDIFRIWDYISFQPHEGSQTDFNDKQKLFSPPVLINTSPTQMMQRTRQSINYFLLDKRNDFLLRCIGSLNRESFLNIYKELPIRVFECLVYFLYLYDKPFINEHLTEFISILPDGLIKTLLNDNIESFCSNYIHNLVLYQQHITNFEFGYDSGVYLNGLLATSVESDIKAIKLMLGSKELRFPGYTEVITENSINKSIRTINFYTKDDDKRENIYYYFKDPSCKGFEQKICDNFTPIEVLYDSTTDSKIRIINGKEFTMISEHLHSVLNKGYAEAVAPAMGFAKFKQMTKDIKLVFVRPTKVRTLKRGQASRNLPVASLFQHPILIALLQKLDAVEEILLWDNYDELYIELINYANSYFIFNKASSAITFYNDNGIKYNVVTNYGPLVGVWLLSTTNIFLLEQNGQYSLLVLLSERYNKRIQQKNYYWVSYNANGAGSALSEPLTKRYSTIIPLHFTGLALGLDTNKSIRDDIMALYISYYISDNITALNLLYPYYKNRVHLADSDTYIYPVVLKDWKDDDNPLWGLYKKGGKPDRIRASYYVFGRPNYVFGRHILTGTYDTSILHNKENLQLIHHACDVISRIKANIGTKDFRPEEALASFLKNFRYLCTVTPTCSSRGMRFPHTSHSEEYLRSAVNDLLFTNKHFPSPSYMYIKYYKDIYSHLIDIKYEQIATAMGDVDKDTCFDDKCGRILKMLEPLDKFVIYGFENPREAEEVLFEIQYTNFLRSSQKALLERMYVEPEGVANEILMGQGKTTTLTPMILLNKYYKGHLSNFTVVLPSHLVPQSFDIIYTSLPILDNFNINGNSAIYQSVLDMDEPSIQVVSDSSIKYIVLKKCIDKIKGDGALEEPDLEKQNFFIFDEVDTLLNALKSDLNVPFNGPQNHPNIDIIFDVCFDTIKNYIYKTTMGISAGATINIMDPRTPARTLYSAALNNSLAPIIQNKVVTTLKKLSGMTYNQNYGFGTGGQRDAKNMWIDAKGRFTAIPYSANHSPINDSEFTDFELFVILTLLSYFYSPIRSIDVEQLLLVIVNKFNLLKTLIDTDPALQEVTLNAFFPEIKDIFNKNLILYTIKLIQINKPYTEELEQLVKQINTDQKKTAFIHSYMKLVIIERYIKINLDQYNISMVDIYSRTISNNKVSFSGTVNFNKPGTIIQTNLFLGDVSVPVSLYNGQIVKIEEDLTVRASIEASFYGFTTREPALHIYTDGDTKEADLIQFVLHNIDTYQALIDTCGIILNTKVEDVVKMIQVAAPNKSILFINNKDVRQVLLPTGEIINYRNQTYSDLFMYYDHKHCVGTDFKQPFKMHGLVTVGTRNNLTEIAQGIFRLRNINIGHSVDFYCSDALKLGPVLGGDTTMKRHKMLYDSMVSNDRQAQLASLPASQLQCAKYVYRIEHKTPYSYCEEIYFDTIKLSPSILNDDEIRDLIYAPGQAKDGVYKTYEQYIIDTVARFDAAFFGLKLKNTIGSREADALATNFDIEVDVAQDIDQDIDIEVNQNKVGKKDKQYNYNSNPFTFDDYIDISGNCYSDSGLNITDEKGTSWTVRLSGTAETFIHDVPLRPRIYNPRIWFYLTNERKPNTILVLSYNETIALLNMPRKLDSGITIYDCYGMEYYTNTKRNIPNVVRLLLAEQSMNILEKFNTLIEYCKRNKQLISRGPASVPTLEDLYAAQDNTGEEAREPQSGSNQFSYYNKLLGFNYPFMSYMCDTPLNPMDATSWIKTFNLPKIKPINNSPEAAQKAAAIQQMFMKALTAAYYRKYPLPKEKKAGGRRTRKRR